MSKRIHRKRAMSESFIAPPKTTSSMFVLSPRKKEKHTQKDAPTELEKYESDFLNDSGVGPFSILSQRDKLDKKRDLFLFRSTTHGLRKTKNRHSKLSKRRVLDDDEDGPPPPDYIPPPPLDIDLANTKENSHDEKKRKT